MIRIKACCCFYSAHVDEHADIPVRYAQQPFVFGSPSQ